ncbi:MAG: OmpA family protein [Hyphomonadaceae bacterium]|nr:OmpA family protein [Hyphomonadaceae bacterium]
MRSIVIAMALFAVASPALAQNPEMDAAEQEMRSTMAPAGATVERVAPDEVRLIMPSDITFDFNRAEVRHEFSPYLRDLARTLARYPGMSVNVVGHADAIGSDSYNQRLSERRAFSVSDVLRRYGVDYRRISSSGRGEWEPVATNAEEWGRARNRRVEISVKSAK